MSASYQVNITLPVGYWLSWYVTAQCCYDQAVKLTDGTAVIFSASKQSTSNPNFLILTQTKSQSDLHRIASISMVLTVQSVATSTYTPYAYSYTIIDPKTGNIMGSTYDIFLEDKESDPSAVDFNDVAIHLVALKSSK